MSLVFVDVFRWCVRPAPRPWTLARHKMTPYAKCVVWHAVIDAGHIKCY